MSFAHALEHRESCAAVGKEVLRMDLDEAERRATLGPFAVVRLAFMVNSEQGLSESRRATPMCRRAQSVFTLPHRQRAKPRT